MRRGLVLSVLVGLFGAARAAEASTVVVNVSTVSQLYSQFAAADADPNNLHEIHLAAGTYSLICPGTTDTLTTKGALKLNKGNVLLIGAGSDENMAANYVIDGGWNTSNCSSLVTMHIPGASPTVPTLEVRGVYLQNGKSQVIGRSAIDLSGARLTLRYSRVFHTGADATGGAAIGTAFSTVTLYRSMVDGATMEDFPNGCGSGLFSYGGAMYLSGSTATITESSIMGGNSCRGGGIAFMSSASTDVLAVTNSTIAFNTAVISGGAIYAHGPGAVSLNSSTIAGNAAATGTVVPGQLVGQFGGGVAFDNFTGRLTMKGNIVAENKATSPVKSDGITPIIDADDCYGSPVPSSPTASFNLIGKQGNCTFAPVGRLVGRYNAPVHPRLGTFDIVWMVWPGLLGMYNGLEPGSVAFGANGGNCQYNDQRGTLRVPISCDLGAYQTACAHDPCLTGAKLSSSCGGCVESICSNDAHCCSSTWDSSCVNQIASVCGQSCQ